MMMARKNKKNYKISFGLKCDTRERAGKVTRGGMFSCVFVSKCEQKTLLKIARH